MDLIAWDSALETGHSRIDEQHKTLLEAVNHLSLAIDKGRGPEEVRKTLVFLAQYTLLHFHMEADLMDLERYPEAARHKKLHHGLVVKVSELMNRYDHEGPAALTLSTMDFLGGWLVEHIQGEDFRLAEFLRGQGTTPQL